MKTVRLDEKGQRKLGDKEEFFYALEETESSINQLIDSLRKCLAEEGKSVQQLMEESDANQLNKEYEIIRRYLGINAGRCQEDALGLIRKLLKDL